MRPASTFRTGAEVLIDQLVIHGVRHLFCVPDFSTIPYSEVLCLYDPQHRHHRS